MGNAIKLVDNGDGTFSLAANISGSATEAKQDEIKTVLETLATEVKTEEIRVLLDNIDDEVATQTTLEAARVLLDSIDGKDFATQTTLASIKDGDGIKKITDTVSIKAEESKVSKVFVITPNDESDVTHVTTGLYIGEAGDIKVDFAEEGEEITIVGLAAGVWHPIQVKKVYATGTVATGVLGAY